MKLVFALYKYFPFGGLQKDMLAIANECASRGHQVHIFCQSWEGSELSESDRLSDKIEINILPNKPGFCFSKSNHGKNEHFVKRFNKALTRINPDLVVGFNKIPGIDIYYAADTCFKAKLYEERPWIYRLLPRYRSFLRSEGALFNKEAKTHILVIAQSATDEYKKYYYTDASRFTLLPPGISRDRINDKGEHLFLLHDELALSRDQKIVLMVGSGFRTKGLDRAISALAALPEAIKNRVHLVIAGVDNKKPFVEQAKQLDINEQLHFLGGRKDVPKLLRCADVLIHPAYRENTGTVLLEAAVAGLPVITTDVCGYAHYIKNNHMGIVLTSPFEQQKLNAALYEALFDAEQINKWRNNGLKFAHTAEIYDMPKKAADVIEAFT